MTGNTLEQRVLLARIGELVWRAEHLGNAQVTLEELRAIEAALRLPAGEGWVSVNERLPGAHEHVEVWPDPRDDTYSFYAHSDGGTNGVKAGNWYYNDRHGDDYVIRVTHWRTETAAPRHETGEGS